MPRRLAATEAEIMDSTLRYEILAEAFRIMTGHMAPGKDAPSATYPAPFETRKKAYDDWLKENGTVVRAMLHAVEKMVE